MFGTEQYDSIHAKASELSVIQVSLISNRESIAFRLILMIFNDFHFSHLRLVQVWFIGFAEVLLAESMRTN